MAALNVGLIQNSYMLIFGEANQTIFTFALPPQSEEFTHSQRINETKTFNGSVISNYGNDAVPITLNGSTVNNELKLVYAGTKSSKLLSGEDEIFYLKKLIEENGNRNTAYSGDDTHDSNRLAYLYGLENVKEKSYEVYIKDFQIKRDKGAPFCYNYTLQMIGWPITAKMPTALGAVKSLENSKVAQFISTATKKLGVLTSLISVGLAAETTLLQLVNNFVDMLNAAQKQVEGLAEIYATPVIDTISNMASVVDETSGVIDSYSWKRISNIGQETKNSIEKLKEAAIELSEAFDDKTEDDITAQDMDRYGETASNMFDTQQKLSNELMLSTLEFCRETELELSCSGLAVNPPNEYDYADIERNDGVLRTYGVKTVSVMQSDTWDILSQKHYGTPEYASMLQLYNAGTELSTGAEIKIPNLKESENFSDNLILNSTDKVDNYGIDIGLSADGDILVTSNGDLGTTSGTDNLTQAITSRLSSSVSSRVRNAAYGINARVGLENSMLEAVIVNSVKTTFSKEPRIDSIESITYEGNGSALNLEINYTDINGASRSYKGGI